MLLPSVDPHLDFSDYLVSIIFVAKEKGNK